MTTDFRHTRRGGTLALCALLASGALLATSAQTGTAVAGPAGAASSAAWVYVNETREQVWIVRAPIELRITASGSSPGTLRFSGTGLPAGVTIDPVTGAVSGTPATKTTGTATVTVTDAEGTSASAEFAWSVAAATGPDQRNEDDVPIPDGGWTRSLIRSTYTGRAEYGFRVWVDIKHPVRGQIALALVDPNGGYHTLKDSDETDDGENLAQYFDFAAGEVTAPARGLWTLEIGDVRAGVYRGHLDRWKVVFNPAP
ncbi:putative Ig domain-containing protein [Streptomyces sp. NBC_01317]|uniref:putative Ig domain-containing protein n=1 Tax=Streptomyces sp. NBC_01317 TaxID=2903822 RepID=UPI002E154BA3|nr:putative Ig domain-containing protein [Streptomyces sp. NBC_01317]